MKLNSSTTVVRDRREVVYTTCSLNDDIVAAYTHLYKFVSNSLGTSLAQLLVEGSAGHPAIFKLGTAGYTIAIIIIIGLFLGELYRFLKKHHKKRF